MFISKHSEAAGKKKIPIAKVPALPNARWHFKGDPQTVIVFVHGLLSSSDLCWQRSNGPFWPDIVRDDQGFDGASIFLAGYHTAVDSAAYDIAHCAREVFDSLRFGHGDVPPPLQFRRIVFVAHSLGGVVVRRLLEENSTAFEEKQVGLVLLASPSLGSSYADVLGPLARLYGLRTAQDLVPDGPVLRDIDYRFRGLLESRRILNLKGAEACEHHGPLRWKFLPWRMKPIVNESSSCRYFGQPKIIPDSDHFDIVKPHGSSHDTHKFLLNFFRENFGTSGFGAQKNTYSDSQSLASKVLFDVYSKPSQEYCIPREVDEEFSRIAALRSIWISGPSGCGKTTLIKRYLDKQNLAPLELTLSRLAGRLSEEAFIEELIDTMNTREGSARGLSFSEAVEGLTELRKRSRVALFIDEVPFSKNDDNAPFVKTVSALLDAVKKRCSATVQVFICSIEEPDVNGSNTKILEQLNFLSMRMWTVEELLVLRSTVETTLPELRTNDGFAVKLIAESGGSPRFLKSYYLRRIVKGADQENAEATLAATKEAFKTYGIKS